MTQQTKTLFRMEVSEGCNCDFCHYDSEGPVTIPVGSAFVVGTSATLCPHGNPLEQHVIFICLECVSRLTAAAKRQ